MGPVNPTLFFACVTLKLILLRIIDRSVHNTRIERLWVDLTAQIGAKWSDFFSLLETHYGLDADNIHHLWLLHYLFLTELNREIDVFVETWNNHLMNLPGQRTRTPLDMFTWDMQVCGLRGNLLPAGELSTDTLTDPTAVMLCLTTSAF